MGDNILIGIKTARLPQQTAERLLPRGAADVAILDAATAVAGREVVGGVVRKSSLLLTGHRQRPGIGRQERGVFSQNQENSQKYCDTGEARKIGSPRFFLRHLLPP